jgi:glycosyltransferase involved in cell wall biosynthesis
LTPTVSFFMASKNRRGMIPRAIASVLAQTWLDWELVICDGSDEPYGVVSNDPRVRIFHQPNSGPAEGFQLALDACRGEFVMPMADDDKIAPGMASVIVGALQDTGRLWGYAMTAFQQNGETLFLLGDAFDLDRLRQGYYLGGAVFWRKSLTDRIGGFDTTFDGAADYDLYLRMAEDSAPVQVPWVGYFYNDHPLTDTRVNQARQADATHRIIAGARA